MTPQYTKPMCQYDPLKLHLNLSKILNEQYERQPPMLRILVPTRFAMDGQLLHYSNYNNFFLGYMTVPYNVIICGCSEKSSECDDGSEAGEVHEEERGHTLHMESVLQVTHVPLGFPLHIRYQATKQPVHNSTVMQ